MLGGKGSDYLGKEDLQDVSDGLWSRDTVRTKNASEVMGSAGRRWDRVVIILARILGVEMMGGLWKENVLLYFHALHVKAPGQLEGGEER